MVLTRSGASTTGVTGGRVQKKTKEKASASEFRVDEAWSGTAICGMRMGVGVVCPAPVLARSADDAELQRQLGRVCRLEGPSRTMGGKPTAPSQADPVVQAVASGSAFAGGSRAVAFAIIPEAAQGVRAEFVGAALKGRAVVVSWRKVILRGPLPSRTGELGFCAASLAGVPASVTSVTLACVKP